MQKGEAMTTIFLSYESSDHACAEQVRQGLEQAGYTVWREPDYPTGCRFAARCGRPDARDD